MGKVFYKVLLPVVSLIYINCTDTLTEKGISVLDLFSLTRGIKMKDKINCPACQSHVHRTRLFLFFCFLFFLSFFIFFLLVNDNKIENCRWWFRLFYLNHKSRIGWDRLTCSSPTRAVKVLLCRFSIVQ